MLARDPIDTEKLVVDHGRIKLNTRVFLIWIVERILAESQDVKLIATGYHNMIGASTLGQKSIYILVGHSIGVEKVSICLHAKWLSLSMTRPKVLLKTLPEELNIG